MGSGSLEFTGERMVPEQAPVDIFWEHIYRYRFALQFVRGKRVLDIACGEGYGTAALRSAGAASVIGMDISEEACQHARARYGVDARVGDAARLDLPDASVDVIVSFETIEHIPEPEAFLCECERVLAPDGILVVSTPNKDEYNTEDSHNEFHCSEMTLEEFQAALRSHFRSLQLYAHRPLWAPRWSAQCVAAERSPWVQFKGGWRARRALLGLLVPAQTDRETQKWREDPVSTILAADGTLSRWASPYVVRESHNGDGVRSKYYVAVARR